jgi:hypothetical protein
VVAAGAGLAPEAAPAAWVWACLGLLRLCRRSEQEEQQQTTVKQRAAQLHQRVLPPLGDLVPFRKGKVA